MNRNNIKNNKDNIGNMSTEELENQKQLNNKRMIGNGATLGGVTIGSLFVFPPVAIIPLGIGALRLYWLNQNNKEIDNQLTLTKKKKM